MLTDDEIRALLANVKDIHPMYGAEVPAGTIAELATRLLSAEAKVKRQNAILQNVERWWLAEGMEKFTGAPHCIFALRTALQERTNAD
jgi:hypothetical protein